MIIQTVCDCIRTVITQSVYKLKRHCIQYKVCTHCIQAVYKQYICRKQAVYKLHTNCMQPVYELCVYTLYTNCINEFLSISINQGVYAFESYPVKPAQWNSANVGTLFYLACRIAGAS